MILSRSVSIVMHPRGNFVVYPLVSLEVVTTGKYIKSLEAVIHMQESTHNVPKSASPSVLGRMQLTLVRLSEHLAAFRAWCQRCRSAKTRRAPFRRCRDARVRGRKITTMHVYWYTPPAIPE